MEHKKLDEHIIQQYKDDETLMIRLFAQWCANHELDAQALYQHAYPGQPPNDALQKVIEEDEGMDELFIDNETMLDVLQLYGNDDLAFAVAEEISRLAK